MTSKLPQLAKMFEVPDWLDAEEVEEDLSFFPELTALGIHSAAGSLGAIERQGMIPESVSKIFEFGSGYGEGLVALDMFARERDDAVVIGSELAPECLHVAMQVASFLPNVVTVDNNGLDSLDEQENVDLVFANMFGPSYHDTALPSLFIPSALRALAPEGKIIMNSDKKTMTNVEAWTDKNLREGQAEVIDPQFLPYCLDLAQTHMVITK